jgi:hypothetical protein
LPQESLSYLAAGRIPSAQEQNPLLTGHGFFPGRSGTPRRLRLLWEVTE